MLIPPQVILLEPTATLQWERCSPLPHPRKHVQAIAVKGKVYIGSGYACTDDVAYEVYCYAPATDQWEDSSNSLTCYFAMASFDTKVLLIGGKEKNKSFSSRVQVLMPDGKFEDCGDIPGLPTARAGCMAASLAFNLVVAGGYSEDKNRDRVRTVEVFDRRSKMWCQTLDLPQKCAEMKAAVALGNQWFLLGGSNQYNEVFTISLQQLEDPAKLRSPSNISENGESSNDSGKGGWKTVAKLPHEFSFVSIFGGSLVAMGGEKDKFLGFDHEYSCRVLVYNSNKNEWLHIADLPTGLSKSTALTLPSGEMLVIGGRSNASKELDTMYKCKLACPM